MPSVLRAFDRGTHFAIRQLRDVGDEFRERRLGLGLSQAFVAQGARISRSRYVDVEAANIATLSITELNRIASILGLDVSVRLYPGGAAVRDAAHSGKLGTLLGAARSPLRRGMEVPLPQVPGRAERRAWDAVLFGMGERTAIELEMRLRDAQAVERRVNLKRRDDPTEHFLLVIADTRNNRAVLEEMGSVFADLPRLRRRDVLAALRAGRHPPTGLMLF